MKHLTSRDNVLFKSLKKINDSARERKVAQQTLLDGVHLIEAYIACYGEPKLLIIPEGKSSREAAGLLQQAKDESLVMFPTLMYDELTPVTSSTGILALVDIPEILRPENKDFVLLLEDIQDPGNLGAILRTAAAANVSMVLCSKGCTDVWSPKCLRGGQGAHFVLPIVENVNLVDFAKTFIGQVLATKLNGQSIYSVNLTIPTILIIGNEGAGISHALMQVATHKINIPMAKGVESLNAAVAAAVCMYERVRQCI